MRFRSRYFSLFMAALICLWLLKLIFSHYSYRPRNKNDEGVTSKYMEPYELDYLLVAGIRPARDRSIFFYETNSTRNDRINYANLSAHKACAVESAALHNPNSNVFVIFGLPAFRTEKCGNGIMSALLSYSNVHLRNVDLWNYAQKTLIGDWFRTYNLFESKNIDIHVADFLRLVTLWRYGGTHLSLNVVTLESFEGLPPNYVLLQPNWKISIGVINFASFGIGNTLAEYCLNNFKSSLTHAGYKENIVNVVTRALLAACRAVHLRELLDPNKCKGFKIYAPGTFCAISWKQWNDFFDRNRTGNSCKHCHKPCIADLWSNIPKSGRYMAYTSRNSYKLLAKRNCPKVFAAAKDLLSKK